MTISTDEFQYLWQRVKEKTASSLSDIHYDHYTATVLFNKISTFLARETTLAGATENQPERLSHGLTIILEKIAGCALVNKFRATLLMEADFNFHNKLIFGKRMIDSMQKESLISPE